MHKRDSKDHTLTRTYMNQYFNIVSHLGLCSWTAENPLGNVGWLAAPARARLLLGHKNSRCQLQYIHMTRLAQLHSPRLSNSHTSDIKVRYTKTEKGR